jgi:hypothetical protein
MADVMMPENNNEGNITITIDVPSAASTRAITEGSANDHAINRIDVLIFNTGTYAGRVSPVFINDISTTQKSFTVRVPKDNLELVILANSKDAIDAIPTANFVVGTTTKTQAYALLTESLPAGNIWNAQPGSTGYRDFPMWGEITVNTNTATTAGVTLVRALAKINVSFLNTTISDKLTITGISLYNYHTNGKLASQNWNFTTPASSTPDPTAMTFKQGGFANGVNFPASVIVGNQIIDEIFLFEVAPPTNPSNPTVTDRVASTCIIISGYYKGADPTNTTELSFYRIDLKSDAGVYYGVTRNHNYDIVIQDVRGPGANTGEIAYDSELVNITATVREWGAGYEVDMDYSGQYKMITNDSEFTFLSTGMPAQTLSIFSDHPGGWTVEPGYPDWINLSITASSNTTGFVDMEITCNQYTGNTVRTGEFFIRTEGLRKKITVIQYPFTIEQPNPTSTTLCPNETYTIVLAPATGVPVGEITYQWQSSTDNINWNNITINDTSVDYTIPVNTFTSNTYFRRQATAQGITITSDAALISLPALGIFPDNVSIGGAIWSTCNVGTPNIFVSHPSNQGMLFQWNRNIGWSSENPLVSSNGSGWDGSTPSQSLWTSTPCPTGYRLPTSTEMSNLINEGSVWLTSNEAGALGLGCTPGRLFGTTTIAGFDPNNHLFLISGNTRGVTGAFSPFFGGYWANAVGTTPSNYAMTLGLNTNDGSNSGVGTFTPAFGISVRCVRPIPSIEVSALVRVVYDFQSAPLETFISDIAPPQSYQWQVALYTPSATPNTTLGSIGTFVNVPATLNGVATNAAASGAGIFNTTSGVHHQTWQLPENFIHHIASSLPGFNNHTHLVFRAQAVSFSGDNLTSSTDSFEHTLVIEFIRTTSNGTTYLPGYGIDANGTRFAVMRRARHNGSTANPNTIRVALLNVGATDNDGGLGYLVQWGRRVDNGHGRIGWFNDPVTRVTTFTNGANGTPASVARVNSFDADGQATGATAGSFIHTGTSYTSPVQDWSTRSDGTGSGGNRNLWGAGATSGLIDGRATRANTPVDLNGWTARAQNNNPCTHLGANWRVPADFDWQDMHTGTGMNTGSTLTITFPTSAANGGNVWNWIPRRTGATGGIIMTNPDNGASVFLPAAGNRARSNGNPGVTISSGSVGGGRYWTSTQNSVAGALFVTFGRITQSLGTPATTFGVWIPRTSNTDDARGRSYGFSVRCVQTPP